MPGIRPARAKKQDLKEPAPTGFNEAMDRRGNDDKTHAC
jgi:hypothetical protein